jgi:hypothetical protein
MNYQLLTKCKYLSMNYANKSKCKNSLKAIGTRRNSAVLEHFVHKVKYRKNGTAPTTSNPNKRNATHQISAKLQIAPFDASYPLNKSLQVRSHSDPHPLSEGMPSESD